MKKRGHCLICLDEIQYGYPNRFHKKQGDKWLEKMARRHKRKGGLTVCKINEYSIKIAGYDYNDIKSYLCDKCFNDPLRRMPIASEAPEVLDDYKAKLAEIALNQKNDPESRFSALLKILDKRNTYKLGKMRYKNYLESNYWDIIRTYVFCVFGDKCSFCGNQAEHLHHADYESRNDGLDHEYLENLYPCCHHCHEKIHHKCEINLSDGQIIYLGNLNINLMWSVFIAEEKEPHVRKKYIETKQKDYLKESRFLDFIIKNKQLIGSNFNRQFNPK